MEARVSLVPHLPENLPEAYRQVETLCRAMLAEKEESGNAVGSIDLGTICRDVTWKVPRLGSRKRWRVRFAVWPEKKPGLGRKPEPEEESPYRAMLLAAMEEEKE